MASRKPKMEIPVEYTSHCTGVIINGKIMSDQPQEGHYCASGIRRHKPAQQLQGRMGDGSVVNDHALWYLSYSDNNISKAGIPRMNRNAYVFCSLTLTLAALGGCSSKPPADEAGAVEDKIQGKLQINLAETSRADAALNGGGPTVYLLEGTRHYRLFFNRAIQVEPGKEYVAEGIYAQTLIDEIGDPDQGKNGYPPESSCGRVVRTAWSGLPFDLTDAHVNALRARVKRYPARPVFLVKRLTPVPPKEGVADSAESEKDAEPEDEWDVSVPADKQQALLIESAPAQTAPLWEPAGGTVLCGVIVDRDGTISQLTTGKQLCEAVPWSKFRYKPTVQGGKPVKVKTEVEVRFEPRK